MTGEGQMKVTCPSGLRAPDARELLSGKVWGKQDREGAGAG